MKILFTAFSISKGLGGHIRSMREVRSALESDGEKCATVIVGSKHTVRSNSDSDYYIDFSKVGIIGLMKQIKQIMSEFKPDIIHSFDEYSFLLFQINARRHRILTRCGGPNPVRYPYAEDITLFSQENLNFFQSQEKYSSTNFSLIPQRVQPFECDKKLISKLKGDINLREGSVVILRVARISQDYKHSIEQTINLFKLFNDRVSDKEIRVIILGAVYDQQVLDSLVSENPDQQVSFVTASEYVKEARKVLDIADIVVGTGRGFMEGAARGKIMFAPLKDNRLPVLVNIENIEECAKYNFSQRLELSDSQKPDIDPIKILASRKKLESESLSIFDDYFNITKATSTYRDAYKKVCNKREFKNSILTIMLNFVYCKYLIIRYS